MKTFKAVLGKGELSDDLKDFYTEQEDGSAVLNLEGIDLHPSVAALKRAKDYEKEEKKGIEAKLKKAEADMSAIVEERDKLLKGGGDQKAIEALEASWSKKLADKEGEWKGQIESATASLNRLLVDNVAQAIATEISTAPTLIMPHLKSRLTAEVSADGQHVTRVLDKDGQKSALTLDELKKEIRTDPMFSPILIASKANGGGTPGKGDKSGGGASDKIEYAKMGINDLKEAMAAKIAAEGGNE